jgi:hypothetical protein
VIISSSLINWRDEIIEASGREENSFPNANAAAALGTNHRPVSFSGTPSNRPIGRVVSPPSTDEN